MKLCTKCGQAKEESEFFVKDKQKDRLHAQCKLCYKTHRRTYYLQHYSRYKERYLQRAKARREKLRDDFHHNLLEYLSGKACVICGENDVRVLEFDHLDPTQKSFSISQATRLGYSWEATLTEIEKCRVLCASCHKKHTAAQFQWYKNLQ